MDPGHLPSYALPLLLLGGFRVIIDEVHRELGAQGHPDLRPVHGFALQAVDQGAGTVGELARRTGVSKQAAAKTAAGLLRMGYLHRTRNPDDGRSQLLRLTPHGRKALRISSAAFDRQRAAWIGALGEARFNDLQRALTQVAGYAGVASSLDFPGWLS